MVFTTILVLALSVIGLAGAVAAVESQKKLTEQALQKSQDRAMEVETQFQLAQTAVDQLISIAEVELSNDPVQESLRQRLLESAAEYYQQFIDERDRNEKDTGELAKTYEKVQQILNDLAVLGVAFNRWRVDVQKDTLQGRLLTSIPWRVSCTYKSL